ncbi:MAG: hypothetical protein ACOYOV_17280 [Bacteroidales bacterium]
MDNPATTDLGTGIIDLHPSFYKLSTNRKKFVLAHEKGHFNLQTMDELKADNYAIEQVERFHPKDIYDIQNFLTEALPKIGSENVKRRQNIMLKALYYDYIENGNYEAYKKLQQMKKKKILNKIVHFEGIQLDNGSPVNENSRNTAQDNGPIDLQIDNSNLPDNPDQPVLPNPSTDQQVETQVNNIKKYFTTQNIIIAIILIGIAYLIYKN